MESYRRKSSEQWSEILADWQASGESQRGYCRSKGLTFSSFTYWKRKLSVIGLGGGEKPSMVKIGSLKQLRPSVEQPVITVRAGGIEVDLHGGESEDVLKKIFRALRAAS